MHIKQSKIWKFVSSLKLAITLLTVISLCSLVGTFFPNSSIYSSKWFIFLLALFALNLFTCLLSRISFKGRQLGTSISHISVLAILIGGLIGMVFGQRGYIEISKGQEVNSFFTQDKKEVKLGFSLRLDDFIYSEYIGPKEKLLVYPRTNYQETTVVNQVIGAGVYQVPKEGFCNLQEKPISGISPEIGSESEIADTGYRVKVLRYVPDFVMDTATKKVSSRSAKPDNPAIQIELRDKTGVGLKVFWVFARYPDMHKQVSAEFRFAYEWAARQPKDFLSKITIIKDGKEALRSDIRVNSPLKFGDYAFFQSSYDTDNLNWTGLRVVRDPGVAVVYLGFVLLILGLSMRFYLNPFFEGGRR